MEIIHRISNNTTQEMRDELLLENIKFRFAIDSVEISESDPRWPRVKHIVEKWEFLDFVHSKFSIAEERLAAHLVVQPSWHHGYPEPSDDNGYLEATFDLSEYCESCGVGLKQKAPFRLIKEPKWGNKSLFQLNWIYDEYFAKPETWREVFEPMGIGCRPVVLNRTGEILDTVVQLDIPCIVDLEMGDHPFKICPICHRKRYDIIKIGFLPSPTTFPAAACKSSQFVGTGAGADRYVLVCQEMYRRVTELGLKGIQFTPCDD